MDLRLSTSASNTKPSDQLGTTLAKLTEGALGEDTEFVGRSAGLLRPTVHQCISSHSSGAPCTCYPCTSRC